MANIKPTRRAILSYSRLKELLKQGGFNAPELFIKDYQGIFEDYEETINFTGELDERITVNLVNITGLENAHYPNVSSQLMDLQRQAVDSPRFTMDTTGFTMDSTKWSMDIEET